jgi:hypothetical protein
MAMVLVIVAVVGLETHTFLWRPSMIMLKTFMGQKIVVVETNKISAIARKRLTSMSVIVTRADPLQPQWSYAVSVVIAQTWRRARICRQGIMLAQ